MADKIDDIHSPTLTVKQTLATVAHSRVARHHRSTGKKTDFVVETLDVVPRALGISHTAETLVGNEFIRGVSGGERKRVSLGEILAAKVSTITQLPTSRCQLTFQGFNNVLG